VDRDIRSLYASGDFSNIRVTAAEAREGITLNYVLQERPALSNIRFTGNTAMSSDKLLSVLGCKTGQRLDEAKLFQDVLAIQSLYQAAGLPSTRVRSIIGVNEVPGEGTVIFEIVEDPYSNSIRENNKP